MFDFLGVTPTTYPVLAFRQSGPFDVERTSHERRRAERPTDPLGPKHKAEMRTLIALRLACSTLGQRVELADIRHHAGV